jgi:hypothetical protein
VKCVTSGTFYSGTRIGTMPTTWRFWTLWGEPILDAFWSRETSTVGANLNEARCIIYKRDYVIVTRLGH